MPRLTAVWTCSRLDSSRIAARVTLATIASEETARANAGSVKCLTWSKKPIPLPIDGNHWSCTANTRIRTIAATNAGSDAETAVITSTLLSSRPGLKPERMPRLTPMAMIRIEEYSTNPAVVEIRDAISVETFSRSVMEIPRFPCTALLNQYQYWTRKG